MYAFHRYASKAAAIAAVAMFSACGSGGSGSGLSIDPGSLRFSARQGGPTPAAQTIRVTITDSRAAQIVAGFPPDADQPSWIGMTLNQTDASHEAWGVSVTSTSLSPGTYHAVIRVAVGSADNQLIGYRDADVTYVVSNDIQAAPAELDFQAVVNDPDTLPTQQVALSGSAGTPWSASADKSWVVLPSSSGTLPATVDVGVNPDGLAAGSYTATVTFTSGGRTSAVTLALTVAAPALVASKANLSFAGVNGAPLPSQAIAVSMNNSTAVGWTAASSAAWLLLSKTSGSTPDSLSVSVDPSRGPLASGAYSGNVTLSSPGLPNVVVPVSLSLTRPTLTVTPSSLVLGGTTGSDFSAGSLQLGLNTGAGSYTWAASKSASWMSLSGATGAVSGTPATVGVTPLPSGLVGGSYAGHVDFTVQVNGDALATSVPVQFNLQAHTLEVIGNGVALTSTPSLSRLSRTLQIEDSLGLTTTPWTATSSQTWLTVTGSGTSASSLTITASPTGLAAGTIHYATVTLSSTDASVERTDTVRVGFWVGSTTPGAKTSLATASTEVVTDPVRPYAYVHDSTTTTISAYNVYTGDLVTTFTAPGKLGAMTISHDGSTLFALDTSSSQVFPVNLETGAVGVGWMVLGASSAARLAYVRTKGFGAILVGNGHAYAVATGFQLVPTFYSGATSLTASRGGRLFCAETVCYPLDFSAFSPGGLSIGTVAVYASGGSNFKDAAISNDGSKVYTASGDIYNFPVTDVASQQRVGTLSGQAYPGNVEVGADGTIYGGMYSRGSSTDVWIYAPSTTSGDTSKQLRLAGSGSSLLDLQLTMSGDGLRVVALTGDPALVFATSP